jgi:hypothetical protein
MPDGPKTRLILAPEVTAASSFVVESLKMFLVCIVAAILYGVIHDQITVGVCLEFFTVFHWPGSRGLGFADGAVKAPLTGVLFIRQSR